jgi:hypothetical protein
MFRKSGFCAAASQSRQNRCSNTPGNHLKRGLRESDAHSGRGNKTEVELRKGIRDGKRSFQKSVKSAGNAGETRKETRCIYSCPVCHVNAGLDIDAIRRRVEHQKMKMMRDRYPGSLVRANPERVRVSCQRPRSGSQP